MIPPGVCTASHSKAVRLTDQSSRPWVPVHSKASTDFRSGSNHSPSQESPTSIESNIFECESSPQGESDGPLTHLEHFGEDMVKSANLPVGHDKESIGPYEMPFGITQQVHTHDTKTHRKYPWMIESPPKHTTHSDGNVKMTSASNNVKKVAIESGNALAQSWKCDDNSLLASCVDESSCGRLAQNVKKLNSFSDPSIVMANMEQTTISMFTWSDKSKRRVPEDYVLPYFSVETAWLHWFCGDTDLSLGPFRFFTDDDFRDVESKARLSGISTVMHVLVANATANDVLSEEHLARCSNDQRLEVLTRAFKRIFPGRNPRVEMIDAYFPIKLTSAMEDEALLHDNAEALNIAKVRSHKRPKISTAKKYPCDASCSLGNVKLFPWSDSLKRRAPESWIFPFEIDNRTLWYFWFLGDKINGIGPFRWLTVDDINDASSKSRLLDTKVKMDWMVDAVVAVGLASSVDHIGIIANEDIHRFGILALKAHRLHEAMCHQGNADESTESCDELIHCAPQFDSTIVAPKSAATISSPPIINDSCAHRDLPSQSKENSRVSNLISKSAELITSTIRDLPVRNMWCVWLHGNGDGCGPYRFIKCGDMKKTVQTRFREVTIVMSKLVETCEEMLLASSEDDLAMYDRVELLEIFDGIFDEFVNTHSRPGCRKVNSNQNTRYIFKWWKEQALTTNPDSHC
ncbi:hypothetical protein Ae201684_009950 [Aphanomyces euteiches]|uniref:Uncharacterized protein n=1 Tax=Aphanomyces euteiches TaxID=100861 RepID=A0A6G0WZX6_9STRA|nr:hypothetical protein Ae201684_009950 [Aphanomyces euteiches]